MAPERISRAATILPRRRSPANVYGVALMLVASGGTEAPGGESEEWIVTRETDGDVTTVHDLSGAKSWPGGWRPEHKPAYTSLLPDRSGRIRVSRELASERVTDCTDPADWNPGSQTTVPCWRADRVLDAFDHDGTYLGELHRPAGVVFFSPFIRDDLLLASIEDEDGTIFVKLYRIVLPDPENTR